MEMLTYQIMFYYFIDNMHDIFWTWQVIPAINYI